VKLFFLNTDCPPFGALAGRPTKTLPTLATEHPPVSSDENVTILTDVPLLSHFDKVRQQKW
jgi:hypothetical protein